MLQLQNKTPFAANLSLLPNEQGIDTLYVIASARLKWEQRWLLHNEQLSPTEADVYLDEAGLSSLVKPSEYHLGKLATDIIVLGDACAPEGQQVRELDVAVQVEQLQKKLRIFGDRIWVNGQISQPDFFECMPITYERAYGGVCVDENDQVLSAEERNPVGLGHLGQYEKAQFENTLLPNIEDPRQLITSLSDTPTPAGLSAIPPNWQPRVEYAGTYDEAWTQKRAPYLPLDFNKQFFNCANPDLIYPGYLTGGELVQITGMHPSGKLQFQLPQINLIARAQIAGKQLPINFNLETLILEPNDLSISLTWRASVPAGKQVSQVSAVELYVARQTEAA